VNSGERVFNVADGLVDVRLAGVDVQAELTEQMLNTKEVLSND